jgi:hypothetical protein
MTAIKNLPIRLLRHIAKYPNAEIDGSFVNPKPADATAKRQAEQDLWEAVYYLWENGDITPKPSDSFQYRGKITYKGMDTLEASKRSLLAILAASWTIVAAIAVFLAAIMTIVQGIVHFMFL